MQTGKQWVLRFFVFFMNVYYVISWICFAPDILHLVFWFFGLEKIDEFTVYRAVLGGVSFVTAFLLVLLTLTPIHIITKIEETQPFQQKIPGKKKWIIYIPIIASAISFLVRFLLYNSGKLPMQENGWAIWGLATANSVISAANILFVRHFKLELKKRQESKTAASS